MTMKKKTKYERLAQSVRVAEQTGDKDLAVALVVRLRPKAAGGKRYRILLERAQKVAAGKSTLTAKEIRNPAPWQQSPTNTIPYPIAKKVVELEQEHRSKMVHIRINEVGRKPHKVEAMLRQENLRYTRIIQRITGSKLPPETLFRMALRSTGVAKVEMGGFSPGRAGMGLVRSPEFEGGRELPGGLPGSKR